MRPDVAGNGDGVFSAMAIASALRIQASEKKDSRHLGDLDVTTSSMQFHILALHQASEMWAET